MKLKYKLILDAIIGIALLLCMEYTLTGGMIHEILGLAMIFGGLYHMLLNRKYYFGVLGAMKKGTRFSAKALTGFYINVILIIALAGMLVTSLLISNDLFPFISEFVGNYLLFRTLHVLFSVLLVLCMLAHVLLHANLFLGLVRKNFGPGAPEKAWKVVSSLSALLLAGLIFISSFQVLSKANAMISPEAKEDQPVDKEPTQTKETSGQQVENEPASSASKETELAREDETKQETQALVNNETEDDGPEVTLTDYLKSLTCTACGKHCSLFSPRCNRGASRAETAKKQYYEMYGDSQE